MVCRMAPIGFLIAMALWAAAWVAVGVVYEGNTDHPAPPKKAAQEALIIHTPHTDPMEAP